MDSGSAGAWQMQARRNLTRTAHIKYWPVSNLGKGLATDPWGCARMCFSACMSYFGVCGPQACRCADRFCISTSPPEQHLNSIHSSGNQVARSFDSWDTSESQSAFWVNFRCRGYDYVSFPLRTTLMLQDTTATWFLAVSEAHRTFKQKGMTEEELERDRDLAMILASGYLCQGSGAIKAT